MTKMTADAPSASQSPSPSVSQPPPVSSLASLSPALSARFVRGLERLLAAIKNVIWYVMSGLTVGFALVFASLYVPPLLKPFFAQASHVPLLIEKLFEHLGMGFIVAAIAVLFYEWGAHIKDSLRLSGELKALREAVAGQALHDSLRMTFHGETLAADEDLRSSIETFVRSLQQLHQGGDWARYGYVGFLTATMQKLASNATKFATLSTSLRSDPAGDVESRFAIQTTGEMLDRLIAEQVSRLPKGARYSVVSNPRSWRKGRFSLLFKETNLAVARGVHVRRIFVLADRGPHAHGTNPDEVHEVIDEHLRASRDWTTEDGTLYEVRVYDTDDRERLQYLPHDAAEQIFQHHYGVIEHQKDAHAVEVRVDEPDLSSLYIGGLPPQSRELQRFELVWDELTPVISGQRLTAVLRKWEERLAAAEHVRRSPA